MRIELIPVGLDGHHRSRHEAFAEHRLGVLAQADPGTATEGAQQLAIFSKGRAQDPGDGPDVLAMIDRLQDFFGHPLHEGRHPLGLAGRTKIWVIRQMGRWVVRLLLRSGLIRSIFALEFS